MLFIAHFLACLWFLTTWLNLEDDPSVDGSWIDAFDEGSAAEGPVIRQYFVSLFWVTCTLFAQSPMPPTNDRERGFLMVVSLLNRLFMGYIIGKISFLVATLDRQATLVAEKLEAIREYLLWRGTPRELATRIRRYYEYFYSRQAAFDEKGILSSLSEHVDAGSEVDRVNEGAECPTLCV